MSDGQAGGVPPECLRVDLVSNGELQMVLEQGRSPPLVVLFNVYFGCAGCTAAQALL